MVNGYNLIFFFGTDVSSGRAIVVALFVSFPFFLGALEDLGVLHSESESDWGYSLTGKIDLVIKVNFAPLGS